LKERHYISVLHLARISAHPISSYITEHLAHPTGFQLQCIKDTGCTHGLTG